MNSCIKYFRYRRSAFSEGHGTGSTDLSKLTDGVKMRSIGFRYGTKLERFRVLIVHEKGATSYPSLNATVEG